MKTRLLLFLLACFAVLTATVFAQENLLPNGDAEQGEVGKIPPQWVRSAYDGSQSPTDFPFETTATGRNGTKGLKFSNSKGYAWSTIRQFVPLAPGANGRAVFSAWMRADKPTGNVGFHLYMTPQGQKEGGFSSQSSVDVTTEWKRYEVDLDLGLIISTEDMNKYNLRPIIQIGGAGPIEVDDATLTLEPTRFPPEVMAQIKGNVDLGPDAVTVQAPIGITGGIIQRPDGTLLAFTSSFGVRRSTDGGRTWSKSEALAIADKFDKITGVIAMSNGSIGIWNEGWKKSLYFWRSDDGGKTWLGRVQIAPDGLPLHGNVMIELSSKALPAPAGWRRSTYSKTGESNSPSSKSTFRRGSPGQRGDHAGEMMVDEVDEWVYAVQWMKTDRPLETGDEYIFRVATKADKKAEFDLYIEAWNHKTGKGSRTRKRFDGAGDWNDREIKLTVSEDAEGLSNIRLIVQLCTPGVLLRIDDVRMERVAPADGKKSFTVSNASFEHVPPGRLIIASLLAYTFSGLQSGHGAYGIDMHGKRIRTESHGHMMEMSVTQVCYSDDGGDTWKRSGSTITIWKDDGDGGTWAAEEANVVELSDGRLLMFLRNSLGRIYQSFSPDRGARWSYPVATELPASLSPCSLKRIPENDHTIATGRAGDLLVVWNNVSHDEIKRGFRRGRLSAAISKDDGETWINAKTIDTAGLPAISGIAPLSPPRNVVADKDLGELPVPMGNIHYADIAFVGDRVLVKYAKGFINPKLNMGTVMQILSLDWFYED